VLDQARQACQGQLSQKNKSFITSTPAGIRPVQAGHLRRPASSHSRRSCPQWQRQEAGGEASDVVGGGQRQQAEAEAG